MNTAIAKLVFFNWVLMNAFVGLAYFAPDAVNVDLGAAIRIATSWTVLEAPRIEDRRYEMVSAASLADVDLANADIDMFGIVLPSDNPPRVRPTSLELAQIGFVAGPTLTGVREDWIPPRTRSAQSIAL